MEFLKSIFVLALILWSFNFIISFDNGQVSDPLSPMNDENHCFRTKVCHKF